MLDGIVDQLPSMGAAGLLFVMWWHERQERARVGQLAERRERETARVLSVNDHLLDVIRANTEALTALREELRSQRAIEAEWIARLSRQLEQLDEA